jgi:hypothetical protein
MHIWQMKVENKNIWRPTALGNGKGSQAAGKNARPKGTQSIMFMVVPMSTPGRRSRGPLNGAALIDRTESIVGNLDRAASASASVTICEGMS